MKPASMDTQHTSDVELARRGDRAALERVVRAVQPLVAKLALRFFGCPHHAQDASQEALVQIVTKLDRYDGQSSFQTWVYRVASNKFLSIARSPAERESLTTEAFDEELAQPLRREPGDHDSEHGLVVAEVRVGCTLAMLLCLDRDSRLAYILGEISELDHDEAAGILDCTPAAFRKRLERARATITGLMQRRCGVFDQANACRCSSRVPVAVAKGRLDPKRLVFATSHEQLSRFPGLLQQIQGLKSAQRAAAIYRSHPDPETRADFADFLHRLLSDGERALAQG